MVEIDLEDPVVRGFLFYYGLVLAKTLIMSVLTARQRFRKKVFIAPEDVQGAINLFGFHTSTVTTDEDVERVRRAHLNDLENIPIFVLAGILYVLTKPEPMIALNLFRVFAIVRYLHTFVYAIFVVRQPCRAILWGIGYAITWYMLIVGLVKFFQP